MGHLPLAAPSHPNDIREPVPLWKMVPAEKQEERKEEAKLLQIPTGFPLFSMRRTVYAKDGLPVECGRSLFRGDRYTATVISRR